jgi:inner membrane protein
MAMEKQNNINRFKNSISLKLIVIVFLSLLLLIPSIFIRNLISERQERRDTTIREVTSNWGASQTFTGPLILIPYEKYEETTTNCFITRKHYMHLLPDQLDICGDIKPTVRHRGIYEVILYETNLTIKGTFSKESFSDWPDKADKILWNEASIVLGITDLKGLEKIEVPELNGKSLIFEGGVPYESAISTGLHSNVIISEGTDYNFSVLLSIKGSEVLHFIPAGKSNHMNISSTWQTPSFDGATLPENPIITADGFKADWNVLSLTRAYPQKWTDKAYEYEIPQSAFGVSLLMPVDLYQKTTRSVKYALLFIGLTFLVIFFLEVISKKRIHPVQYILTGAALVIFYSLLLALSEHIRFAWAYIIAASSIIGLIVVYSQTLFHKLNYSIITGIVLVVMYAFLFTILHMSDLALLLGNIGLFIILALVMYFSRTIDWYNSQEDESIPE